jgi:hypothetical protein
VVVSLSGAADSANIAQIQPFSHQVHAVLGHETVLDLNFNENAYNSCPDGSYACDASGYNNNCDIYGEAEYISSEIGGYAISFSGACTDYMICGSNSSLNPKEEITLSAWVKKYSNSSGGIIFRNGSYLFNLSGNYVYFNYYDTAWNNSAQSNSALSLNEWHYIAATYSKNTGKVKIYLDGSKDKEQGVNSNEIRSTSNNNYIGLAWTNWCFYGLIDEARVYAEALSSVEIQEHYVQGLEKFLASQAITQAEYEQRMEEFKKHLSAKSI